MRVLLTTRGSSGHVTPLAPFGHALVRAGHEVLVAAQGHFEENVARTGLPFAPVGAPRRRGLDGAAAASSRASGSTRGTTGWSREFFGDARRARDAAAACASSPTSGAPT